MQELDPQKRRKLERLAELIDKGNLAIFDWLQEIEEKARGEKGDPPSKEELLALIEPLIPDVKDGKDYVLTESDLESIALRASEKIKVPIVEKVVEKTEVIKEVPIVTENVVEKAVADTPEAIIEKINSLPPEIKIKPEHIEGLSELKEDVENAKDSTGSGRAGWGAHPLVIQESGTTKVKVARNLNFTGATVTQRPDGVTSIAIDSDGLVSGPASSTDNAIARWDGTTGDLIQNSGITIDDSNNIVSNGTIHLKQATTNATIIGDVSGNARGDSAFDVQSSRSAATDVASGVSAQAMGNSNQASGDFSSVFGISNVASGEDSVCLGNANTATMIDSIAIGRNNTSTQATAVAVGQGITNNIAISAMFGATDDAKITILGDPLGSQEGFVGILNTNPQEALHVTGNIRASGTLRSEVATGTAPLTVASTTLVTNLNADLIDGLNSTAFIKADGTVPLTADWDAGSFEIRAQTLESDVATGTAPLTIASTTLVTNLNADLLDGKNTGTSGNVIPLLDGNNTWSGTNLYNAVISLNTNAGAGTAGTITFNTVSGHNAGSLNLSTGTATNAGNGGTINMVGGNGSTGAGGNAGQITLNGGVGGSNAGGTGGSGGNLTFNGGTGGSNTATAGGNGASLTMSGGNGSTGSGGFGGAAGQVNTSGGNASGSTPGGNGGQLNTRGLGTNAGGGLNTSASASLGAGGSITTNAGGGSINTKGTGSIEMGDSGTRTTFTGAATTDRAISLPDEDGTLLVGAHGVYTPTLTGVANVAASTAYQCQYMQVGSVVTVSGKLDIDPTLTATSTQLGISLPVASNIGANEDVGGTAFAPAIAGMGAAILGDATNNRAQLQFISSDINNNSMYFSFTYRII